MKAERLRMRLSQALVCMIAASPVIECVAQPRFGAPAAGQLPPQAFGAANNPMATQPGFNMPFVQQSALNVPPDTAIIPQGTTTPVVPQGIGAGNIPQGTVPALNQQGIAPALNPQGIAPAMNPQGIAPALNPQGIVPALNPQRVNPAIRPSGVNPAFNPRFAPVVPPENPPQPTAPVDQAPFGPATGGAGQ